MKPLVASVVLVLGLTSALPEAEAQRPRYYRGYYDYAPRQGVRVYVRRPRFEFSYAPAPTRYRTYYRSYAPYPRDYSYSSRYYQPYYPPTRGPVFRDRDDWEDYREELEERREDYEDWLEDRQEEYEERMEELRERREERLERWRERYDD